MTVVEQIQSYISQQSEPKRGEMQELHELILQVRPDCRLWFLDGLNAEGKVISNPNIGYGFAVVKYANGSTKEFFQVGLSANQSGISVYILGLEKSFLADNFNDTIGRATVTGYCIRFRTTKDINLNVLQEAVRCGFDASGQ